MTAVTRALPSGERAWRGLGLALGLGRVALGSLFWVDPVRSVRVAGLDAVTSPRADWLARMTAGRDIAIGAGTTYAVANPRASGPERAAWYLAGAVADLGDTVAIRRGAREGRLAKVPAFAASSGAAVAAAAGLVAAGRELLHTPRGHREAEVGAPVPVDRSGPPAQAPKSS